MHEASLKGFHLPGRAAITAPYTIYGPAAAADTTHARTDIAKPRVDMPTR